MVPIRVASSARGTSYRKVWSGKSSREGQPGGTPHLWADEVNSEGRHNTTYCPGVLNYIFEVDGRQLPLRRSEGSQLRYLIEGGLVQVRLVIPFQVHFKS